ncbi:MAG TPA: FMN-binding negative transcriptional regulator, partial [Puia sp.]|nr:FMN-binding negative transcriptional regulator [Puia sp.]
MYDVPYFKAGHEKEVLEFMQDHPFIVLCGAGKDLRPVATHIPVLFERRDEKLFLLAHAMKKQVHTRVYEENPNVLAIFYGPHTYVSASWYDKKTIASTWNYQAVHASGTLKFVDENGLRNILTRLTEKFENDPQSPALVDKMEKEYVDKMMQAIVGFEIEIMVVEHVFKLSQNRDEKSYNNIIRELENGKSDA